MRIITKLFSVTILLLVAFSCKKETEQKDKEITTRTPVSDNYNISILLDLSDRISTEKNPNPTMEYYKRDLGYIKSISQAFTQHLKTKRIRQIDDKMQIFFNPEPKDSDINSISQKLKIVIDKNNASRDLLNSIEDNYSVQTSKIYESAIKDNNFVGSDIFNFFESKVSDQCLGKDSRNILIILTDGYMFFDKTIMNEGNRTSYITPEFIRKNGLNTKDWEKKIQDKDFGFIHSGQDFSELEILVLGINPNPNNPYEEKVIKAYWTKWFTEMKVKHFEIKNADLPSNMDKIIKDFILNSKQ